MCNKQNLPDRVEKAKAAMLFAHIDSYDASGNVKKVTLPGSDGKQYTVILRRENGLTCELLLNVNGQLVTPDYGKQITYHCLAAVMLAAKEQGYSIIWTSALDDARRLAHFGGKVFKVRAFNNLTNVIYGVMKQ